MEARREGPWDESCALSPEGPPPTELVAVVREASRVPKPIAHFKVGVKANAVPVPPE